jgi:hypothetical protein
VSNLHTDRQSNKKYANLWEKLLNDSLYNNFRNSYKFIKWLYLFNKNYSFVFNEHNKLWRLFVNIYNLLKKKILIIKVFIIYWFCKLFLKYFDLYAF